MTSILQSLPEESLRQLVPYFDWQTTCQLWDNFSMFANVLNKMHSEGYSNFDYIRDFVLTTVITIKKKNDH